MKTLRIICSSDASKRLMTRVRVVEKPDIIIIIIIIIMTSFARTSHPIAPKHTRTYGWRRRINNESGEKLWYLIWPTGGSTYFVRSDAGADNPVRTRYVRPTGVYGTAASPARHSAAPLCRTAVSREVLARFATFDVIKSRSSGSSAVGLRRRRAAVWRERSTRELWCRASDSVAREKTRNDVHENEKRNCSQ